MDIDAQNQYPDKVVHLKSGRSVRLRFLKVSDADAFGDFYASIERVAYRFYCPHPLNRENASKRTQAALSPTVVGVLAEAEGGHIVAYASFQWEASGDNPSIFGICIQKDFRGSGLGEIMIHRIAEIATKFGPPMIMSIIT